MTRMNEQSRYHAEVMAEQEQEEAAQDAEQAYYFSLYQAERVSRFPPDEGSGYDLNDPKHPTWLERQVEAADFARDQAKDASYDKWLDQQEQT